MSACSSTCYDDASPLRASIDCFISVLFRLHHSFILYLNLRLQHFACFLPSSCSTFLATLRMIPIDKQVNKKLLPPILTNGSVTPVTGKRFTFTAIFAMACITRVKLSPRARNAPNAKGHLLKIRMLRKRKTR